MMPMLMMANKVRIIKMVMISNMIMNMMTMMRIRKMMMIKMMMINLMIIMMKLKRQGYLKILRVALSEAQF